MNRPWIKEDDGSRVLKLLLFIAWPFGAWLSCLKDPRSKSSYVVFFLFSVLLLWHMAPTGFSAAYQDFGGILDEFNEAEITTEMFWGEVIAFFSFSEEAPKELYQDFLTWLVKLYTDNYHFMFALAAIPVAFFQLKSLRLITSDQHFVLGFFGLMAMLLMLIPRDIIGVQNPRFTTGYWLLVFCILYCFTEKPIKWKYLLPIPLLPVIHSGMWAAVIMIVAYLLIPKNRRILEILAICSIPLIFVDIDLRSYIDYSLMPDNIVKWAERFASDDAYAKYVTVEGRAGFWWVDSFFEISLKIIYIFMAIQVIRNKRLVFKNYESRNFYPFFLFMFFFINMIQFIPVLGGRYYGMWRVFVFFIWFKTFHFSHKDTYRLLLIFYSWYIIRRYGYVMGGALAFNTPLDIFYTPLPYLMGKGLWW